MIIVTEDAIKQINEILSEEESKFLRVFVEGGGCSGFQYGFDLSEKVEEDDFEIPFEKFSLLVDSMSMQYLQGSTIEYKDDIMGSSFSIQNPNAQTTCGCGSSFSA